MIQRWHLPEQIEDILPAEASRLTHAREGLLKLFESYGYQRVVPPAIEYVESLLTGTGEGNDLRTFKMVDQLSGRTLGLRSDITPQVARIDAHRLNQTGITRLCYEGAIYHALADSALHARERIQVGAELYGHRGLDADLEVLGLLVDALALLKLPRHLVDLGHVGIFRALIQGASKTLENDLMIALQQKNTPRILELSAALDPAQRTALLQLPSLAGDESVLDRARDVLPRSPEIDQALEELLHAARTLKRHSRVEFDLSELRGYDYHTGLVFSVYVEGFAGAIARGGRYDAVGEAFGRARPATGFSIDLGDLIALLPAPPKPHRAWLPLAVARSMAPEVLHQALHTLREQGWVVVSELEGQEMPPLSHFDCQLTEGPTGLEPIPIE